MMTMPRESRNSLPILALEGNAYVAEREQWMATFPYKLVGGAVFFTYAGWMFQKAYFPYGIILRRSIPQTWGQYVHRRAPIAVFALWAWYMQREYPRTKRMDLRCSSED